MDNKENTSIFRSYGMVTMINEDHLGHNMDVVYGSKGNHIWCYTCQARVEIELPEEPIEEENTLNEV